MTNDDDGMTDWQRALYEEHNRDQCGPWLCDLPDPRTHPHKLFHCTRCGTVYRRARYSNRWAIRRWGKATNQ